MSGDGHPKCNLHQSIAQRIHLVLVTNMGEFRSDSEFGCTIWEHDFENMPNVNSWKDKMINNIREVLEKYELRLINQQVGIDISQEEFSSNDKSNMKRIKRRIDITLKANIKKTNEAFLFQETLYISPVWLD
ncbi:MAG: GPW/gp25 family protein [Bacteroidetes bacterium]|nr:GPW/gp25 family protein [Bacteroidota bacterium]